jgi:hypothetical protein|tara:strand:- start:541 stop:687 length:147 start_codon:yes stop_codon:yes gene_type:complete
MIYNVNDLLPNIQLLIEPIVEIEESSIEIVEDKEYVGYLSIKNLRKLS